jgi:hypothetical protein
MKDNKLIAEFMGVNAEIISTGNVHSWSDSPFFYTTEDSKEKVMENIAWYAKYHTSWDWLKPVVDKIEMECGGVPYQLLDCNLYSDIGEVYQAVVEFLKDHACHIELQEWEKNNQ